MFVGNMKGVAAQEGAFVNELIEIIAFASSYSHLSDTRKLI